MTTTDVLAGGLYFGEGPRWHDGRLWFSDFYDHAVKTSDMDGRVEVQFEVANQPSGLGWLPDGRMLIVSMLDRKLLRREADGSLVEHADLSGIATFHCNDMVVDSRGHAFVGNFGFDLNGEVAARGFPDVIANHKRATLARVDPDGSVHAAAEDVDFPNGAVITPDGGTLIVAETFGFALSAFDLAADGTLSNRRQWANLAPRAPDGICLDADGHVWYANPLAPEVVCVGEGGETVQVVNTSQNCYACMLGGPDGQTLFCLTATGAGENPTERTGRIECYRAKSPRAGLP